MDGRCGRDQPSVGSIIPRQVGLGCMKQLPKHDPENQQVSNITPWSLLSSCLGSYIDFASGGLRPRSISQINPFFLMWLQLRYLSHIRNQNRTVLLNLLVYFCLSISMCIYPCIYACVHVCVRTCAYLCERVCKLLAKQAGRQTDRHTDKERDGEMEKEREQAQLQCCIWT